MRQSDILRAVRNRIPDSFAPDGQPLLFIPVNKLRRPTHGCCLRKRSKPTPAQPHEGVVPASGEHLSQNVLAGRVSVDAPTVVNGTGPQCLDDSGQQLADSNRFVIPHGEAE